MTVSRYSGKGRHLPGEPSRWTLLVLWFTLLCFAVLIGLSALARTVGAPGGVASRRARNRDVDARAQERL